MAKNSKRKSIPRTLVETSRLIPGAKMVTKTRGLRTVNIPICDNPAVAAWGIAVTNQTPDKTYLKLREAAEEILNGGPLKIPADIRTVEDRLIGLPAPEVAAPDAGSLLADYPSPHRWSLDLAVEWLRGVHRQHGYTTPQAMAAEFLVSADRLAEVVAPDIFGMVFNLCDAWYWLLLEVGGEHRKALEATNSAAARATAGPARSRSRDEREAVVEKLCEDFWRRRPAFMDNQSQTAELVLKDVNQALPDNQQYKNKDTLRRVVAKIIKKRKL